MANGDAVAHDEVRRRDRLGPTLAWLPRFPAGVARLPSSDAMG